VLVATDIVARGIDIEDLSHVINFDVPADPDAYIHRVGRTARADATGDAFTFVSPDESSDLAAIERAIGKSLPRVTLPGFDYARKPTEKLEIPIQERLAAMRAARGGSKRSRPGPAPRPKARPRPGGGGGTKLDSILDRHAPKDTRKR
jgi:ATP-dependent RNA helicase RhlE